MIDLSEYSFDQRVVGCKLSNGQDVFCKVHELNTNTSLEYRSRFIYFKTYYITSASSIVLSIYPLLQEKKTPAAKIYAIIKMGANLFYFPIVDTEPLLPVDDIFFIDHYNVVPISNSTAVMFNLELTYQFPIAHNQPLYVQLN